MFHKGPAEHISLSSEEDESMILSHRHKDIGKKEQSIHFNKVHVEKYKKRDNKEADLVHTLSKKEARKTDKQ